MSSLLEHQLRRILTLLGPRGARLALTSALDACTATELAVAYYDWSLWSRAKQIPPEGDWRSCGFCAGRGFGKTLAVVNFVLREIAAGRARRIALVGKNEEKCVEILITGETGFLELTPPWLGANWEPSTNTLRFGNGAIATVYSAVEPDNLRGPQHDLAICTEISHWPKTTGSKTLSNLRQGLRLGQAKLLWDSTPKRRDPIMRALVAEHEKDPERHLLVLGSTEENRLNLAKVAYDEFSALRNTAEGRQEFFGEPSNEIDDGLFKESDLNRPHAPPTSYVERIIAVDPSTAGKKYSDAIGIVEAGRSAEGIAFILANLSGKHDINDWPDVVLDRYRDSLLDLLLIETNHAGTTWAKIFSDACKLRGWRFNGDLDEDAKPRHKPGELNFRAFSVSNRQNKAERAVSAANWTKVGRVSFVEGALGDLKERLCDFSGEDNQPDDDVDAFVHAVNYLLRFETLDATAAFRGIADAQTKLSKPPSPVSVSSAFAIAFRGTPDRLR